ncbi:hypothetical protein KJZ71_00670 [Patescibacteria group bacterium]|uniref:Uncharacterized protein n=1 Tax=candidate division WWE3 bacterium TaxID=2053526 RepID=A0A928Y725_UNCKA|nr:hypothetical protein [candidate division WWE3 bacterium]MCL4732302.1 hypothetical protein [Patescibacteria group bacterium]
MTYHHPTLAAGRWKTFTLCEQLANVGSEVHRAAMYRSRAAEHPSRAVEEEERALRALERALELLDLTRRFADRSSVRRELGRVRELLASAYFQDMQYATALPDLVRYFDAFAIAAQEQKRKRFHVIPIS